MRKGTFKAKQRAIADRSQWTPGYRRMVEEAEKRDRATVKENLTARHCAKCDRSEAACRCRVPELIEREAI